MADEVESDLEVNCVSISDGSQQVVLVSLDLLYVTQALREALLERTAAFGVTNETLFVAASHTHYAPAIDDTKPLLGRPDPEYFRQVVQATTDAIEDVSIGPRTSVHLATAAGRVALGVNRRRRRLLRIAHRGLEINQIGMAPNPTGEVDSIASVLRFVSHDGATLAYLWSGACHPTSRGEAALIGADWPGVVRQKLRELTRRGSEREADVPVVFLQGFSGDVRPPSGRRGQHTLKSLLLRVGLGPRFLPMTSGEYVAWTESIGHEVAGLAQRCEILAGDHQIVSARHELPAAGFARGSDRMPPVSFHHLGIGPVSLVGASAEPVSGYASRLRAMAKDKYVIPVGCIDQVIGYWPLERMFAEGGYEVVHHCRSFGISACDPEIEQKVLHEFRSILGISESIGR
jgi:hypothetical protein